MSVEVSDKHFAFHFQEVMKNEQAAKLTTHLSLAARL